MTWPTRTFILIPSYKSAGTIGSFLDALILQTHVPANNLCVIDDGSHDGTDALCREKNVHCLSHDQNRGKGRALATGFEFLRTRNAEFIITMDADGQHSPNDLEHFLQTASKNPSLGICIGQRTMKLGHMPPARIISNRLTSFILSLFCGIPVLDSQCGYRLYGQTFLNAVTIEYNRFEMETEMIFKAARLGFPVQFVPVQTLYLKGQSHISHTADTLRWIRAVIALRKKINRNAEKQ